MITAPKTKNLHASKIPTEKLYAAKIQGSRGKNIKIRIVRNKIQAVVNITDWLDPPTFFVHKLKKNVNGIIGIIIILPIVFIVSREKPASTK